jgi:hypothetical protein
MLLQVKEKERQNIIICTLGIYMTRSIQSDAVIVNRRPMTGQRSHRALLQAASAATWSGGLAPANRAVGTR